MVENLVTRVALSQLNLHLFITLNIHQCIKMNMCPRMVTWEGNVVRAFLQEVAALEISSEQLWCFPCRDSEVPVCEHQQSTMCANRVSYGEVAWLGCGSCMHVKNVGGFNTIPCQRTILFHGWVDEVEICALWGSCGSHMSHLLGWGGVVLKSACYVWWMK